MIGQYLPYVNCFSKKNLDFGSSASANASFQKPGPKGNRRRSIGYCPHLWKSPLQPFQPAQQS